MAGPEDSLDRIEWHLSRSEDPILVILRGHLIIRRTRARSGSTAVESYLRDILDRVCRLPDELQDARLTFHHVLTLVRAIIGRQDESVWGFIKRLNEVRNKTAHHLEPGDLDEIIGSMVERLWEKDTPGLIGRDTPLGRLRRALIFTIGYLTAIRGAVGLRQAYEPPQGIS